jgi:hypothetical protein
MYGPIQEEYHVLPYAENSYTKAQQKVLTKHKTVVVPSTRYRVRLRGPTRLDTHFIFYAFRVCATATTHS